MKTLIQLAKEHQIACHNGRHKVNKAVRNMNDMDVTCIMCGRKMTSRREQNPPFYCYRCSDEIEGVFGRG